MPRGISIAIVFSVLSLALAWVMMSGQPRGVSKQQAAQLRGLDALYEEQLNSASHEFGRRFGRGPIHAEEMVGLVLEEIPKEPFSRSNRISHEFDGKGGWVFIDGTFKANHSQQPGDETKMAPTPTPGPPPTPQPDIAEKLAQESAAWSEEEE